MRFRILLVGLSLFAAAPPSWAQQAPVIDNERVTVWDVRLEKGVAGPATPHDQEAVIMFLEGGTIQTKGVQGSNTLAERHFGDAVFVPKGSDEKDTALSGGEAHEIIIALKDNPQPPYANTSTYPLAFPRLGAIQALDVARAVVWHYSWTPGVPTPMHFHDKDVVVAFRYDGSLKSVTPDGASVVNPYKAGDIRFNRGDRIHHEELTTDRQSAVMLELK